jgi:hypothetical protein
MDQVKAEELLTMAISSGERKQLVTFFVRFCVGLYKSNRKSAEKLFEWITIDDCKSFAKDPDTCISVLIQDPKFLADVAQLISLETAMTKRENLGRPRMKDDGTEVKKRAVVETQVKAEDMGNVDKLLSRLKAIDRGTPEARKIRQTLRKLGHRGGAK